MKPVIPSGMFERMILIKWNFCLYFR